MSKKNVDLSENFGPIQIAFLDNLKRLKNRQCENVLVSVPIKKLKNGTLQFKKPLYCALGVACLTASPSIIEKGIDKAQKGLDSDDYEDNDVLEPSIDIPKTVSSKLGFHGEDGAFINGDEYADYSSLVDMNDSGGSFLEIRDYIIKNPKVVFKTRK